MNEIDPFVQVSDAAVRLAAMIRSVPSESLGVPAATDGLTIDETIRHLYGEFRSVADVGSPRADEDPTAIADQLPLLADLIRKRFEPLISELGSAIYGAAAYILGETIVHGDEIACAASISGYRPTHEDVMVMWSYGVPLLQGLLTPEAAEISETWEIRSTRDGRTLILTIDDATITSDPNAMTPQVRHVFSVDDTAAWMLEFPAQRRPPSDPQTALLVSRFTKP
jgi:hypothetical protein